MLVEALGSVFGDEVRKDEDRLEQNVSFYCLNDT